MEFDEQARHHNELVQRIGIALLEWAPAEWARLFLTAVLADAVRECRLAVVHGRVLDHPVLRFTEAGSVDLVVGDQRAEALRRVHQLRFDGRLPAPPPRGD